MKKLLLISLLLFPVLAMAQLELPYSVKNLNPRPLDFYYYNNAGAPYTNTAQVISQISSSVRYQGMTVNVAGVEYHFKDGIADGQLVVKIADAFNDNTFVLHDDLDPTKTGKFQLEELTTGTEVTLTFPPSSGMLLKSGTNTLISQYDYFTIENETTDDYGAIRLIQNDSGNGDQGVFSLTTYGLSLDFDWEDYEFNRDGFYAGPFGYNAYDESHYISKPNGLFTTWHRKTINNVAAGNATNFTDQVVLHTISGSGNTFEGDDLYGVNYNITLTGNQVNSDLVGFRIGANFNQSSGNARRRTTFSIEGTNSFYDLNVKGKAIFGRGNAMDLPLPEANTLVEFYGGESILLPRIATITALGSPDGSLGYQTSDNRFYFKENGTWLTYLRPGDAGSSLDPGQGTLPNGNAVDIGGNITTANQVLISGAINWYVTGGDGFSAQAFTEEYGMLVSDSLMTLYASNSDSELNKLTFHPTTGNITLTDERATKSGIQYAASGYVTTARSLTDKGYTDANLLGLPLAAPTGAQVGQSIRWNAGGSAWEYYTPGGGGASALDDLTDVAITTPTTTQVLQYNGSTWVNQYYRNQTKTESGTTYSLVAADENKIIEFTNSGPITVTLPNGLSQYFSAVLVKKGAGNITISATGTLESDGTTIEVLHTGAVVYHKGSNVWTAQGSLGAPITPYTDELAQDAIGAMVDASLNYADGTPLLQRAELIGDVTAAAGSNTTTIANDAVTFAKIQNITDNRLLGRSAGSAGDMQEISIGSGLTLSGGTLSATGGGGASALDDLTDVAITTATTTQVLQYNGSTWVNQYYRNQSKTESGTTYSLVAADENKIIEFTNSGPIAVTLPNGLGQYFSAVLVKKGAGNITISATGTLESDGTTIEVQHTGAVVYHKGSNVWTAQGSLGAPITPYTDELSQDAIGAMIDASLTYVDGTPLLQRSALTGDVTAGAGSNATTIANDAVTFAKFQNITDNRLLGRSAGSAGDMQEISIGSGLTLSGGTLSATGGGGSSSVGTGLQKGDGSGGFLESTLSEYSTGNLSLGVASTTGSIRTLIAEGSASNISFSLLPKGTGALLLGSSTQIHNTELRGGTISFESNDATTNTVHNAFIFQRESTGTPGAGIGTGLVFRTNTATSAFDDGTVLQSVSTDITGGSEDFDFAVQLMQNGTLAEAFRLKNTGDIDLGSASLSGQRSISAINTASNARLQLYSQDQVLIDDWVFFNEGSKLALFTSGTGNYEGVRIEGGAAPRIISITNATTAGIDLTIQADAADTGNNNGGSIQLTPGAGSGTGTEGTVNVNGILEFTEEITPATPASNKLRIFAKDIAGKTVPAFIGSSGLDASLQVSLARNKVSLASPNGNSTTLTSWGIALSATGTATAANVATTNLHQSMKRLDYLVTTAASTAVAGFRSTTNQFWRGNAAGLGGFYFITRWAPATGVSTATNRAYVGLGGSTAAPTDVEPSSVSNLLGMGWDAADTNIQFMHNDNSGTATKIDLGASFPVPTTDRTAVYEIALFCAPNGSVINYEITDLVSGAVATGNVNTDIPSNTQLLSPRGWMSVGGTSSVIGIALMSMYIETDF